MAFFRPLDRFVNPELYLLPPHEHKLPVLDAVSLATRVNASMPAGVQFRALRFDAQEGLALSAWIESETGQWQEWFVSPKTGQVLGSRVWGDLSQGRKNVLTFIYGLHYSLALGPAGSLLFGVAALLWSIDCFVGAYLTFPQNHPGLKQRSPVRFLRRWLPAWLLRTRQLFALVFTWHRASGLWLWALLFVFAWSAVGFNLRPVYRLVMASVLGMHPEGHDLLPQLSPPFPEPVLTLNEAYARARHELAREQAARGFSVRREVSLIYASDHGAYAYLVESTLDISAERPRTEVFIDGATGSFLGFSASRGIAVGNTVSSWLAELHTASAFGVAYRVLVALLGLAAAGLSVTGVYIWWRKRKKSLACETCDNER